VIEVLAPGWGAGEPRSEVRQRDAVGVEVGYDQVKAVVLEAL